MSATKSWHGALGLSLLAAIALGTPSASIAASKEPSASTSVAVAQDPSATAQETRPARRPSRRERDLSYRARLLASDPDRVERIGHHIMVGYHIFSDVRKLVEARAIGGIFITDHNVEGRSIAEVRAEIDKLQAIRQRQGLPPLIVAADQEGGPVSRLSPPLVKQATLAQLLKGVTDPEQRQTIVRHYGETQGRQLKEIGVNLNFAPVVDLNLRPNNRSDGQTLLRLRAISDDPETVATVADQYCAALALHDVMCTLKHFPGLGRILQDTHRVGVDLTAERSELERMDWVPFKHLASRPYAAVMLGHIRLHAIDPHVASSYSKRVIQDLIRGEWDYQGLLVTDDFSMGAIAKSKDGITGASIKALQAGVDLLLVAYMEKYYNLVMTKLLEADRKGLFDEKIARESRQRIEQLVSGSTPWRAEIEDQQPAQ